MRHYKPIPITVKSFKDFSYDTKEYGEVIDLEGSLGANVIGHVNALRNLREASCYPFTNTFLKSSIEDSFDEEIARFLKLNGLQDYRVVGHGVTGSNLIEQIVYGGGCINSRVYSFSDEFHGKTPISQLETFVSPEAVSKMMYSGYIVFESVLGGYGQVIRRDNSFITQLRHLQKEYGSILVADEIQFGLYHSGKLFSFMNYDIEPDFIMCGKAFGFPLPHSFLLGKKDFVSKWTSTFQYSAVNLALIIKNIKFIYSEIDSIKKDSKRMNRYIKNSLNVPDENIIGTSFMIQLDKFKKLTPVDFLKKGVMMSVYHDTGRVKAHVSPMMETEMFKQGIDIVQEVIE